MGPESLRSDAVQFTRQAKGLELVPVREDLVERIPFEDTANVEVREMSHGNEGRGVGPCTMFDGQRPEFSLGVLEELVEV